MPMERDGNYLRYANQKLSLLIKTLLFRTRFKNGAYAKPISSTAPLAVGCQLTGHIRTYLANTKVVRYHN